jgi:hypothetical protein
MSLILRSGHHRALFGRKNRERRMSFGAAHGPRKSLHGLSGSKQIHGWILTMTPISFQASRILLQAGQMFHGSECRSMTETQRKLKRVDEGERPWFSTRVKTRFVKAISSGPDGEAPCRIVQGFSLTFATTPGIRKILVL